MFLELIAAIFMWIIVPGMFIWSIRAFHKPVNFTSGFAKLLVGILGAAFALQFHHGSIASDMVSAGFLAIASATACMGLVDLIAIKTHIP